MAAHATLHQHLAALKQLRGGKGLPRKLRELKAWQSKRFTETYADLLHAPRYGAAARFFLEDLYGPKDFTSRDEAMMRILPTMSRILPASAVETASLAIELEALTEDLDQRLARALPAGAITAAGYAKAYRETSTPAERERQVALAIAVGERLDVLVKKPFIGRTLKLMRRPAALAGLADLQDFLERGFEAFRAMDGAGEFLEIVGARERAILKRLFSGAPSPFAA